MADFRYRRRSFNVNCGVVFRHRLTKLCRYVHKSVKKKQINFDEISPSNTWVLMQNVDANKLDLAKWRTYKKLPVFFCTYRKLLGEFCTYKKIPVRLTRTEKSLYACKDDQNGVTFLFLGLYSKFNRVYLNIIKLQRMGLPSTQPTKYFQCGSKMWNVINSGS